MLLVVNVVLIYNVLVCYFYGGEILLGNFDEYICYVIIKMSYLYLVFIEDFC